MIDRRGQVWCADITYSPMRRGLLYLVAIMNWRSHRVLAWRLSNTLEVEFCVETLNEGIGPAEDHEHGPGIEVYRLRLGGPAAACRGPHLDGRQGGASSPKSSLICLGRSLNCECVYLKAWETGPEARAQLRTWLDFYTSPRPVAAFDGEPQSNRDDSDSVLPARVLQPPA